MHHAAPAYDFARFVLTAHGELRFRIVGDLDERVLACWPEGEAGSHRMDDERFTIWYGDALVRRCGIHEPPNCINVFGAELEFE